MAKKKIKILILTMISVMMTALIATGCGSNKTDESAESSDSQSEEIQTEETEGLEEIEEEQMAMEFNITSPEDFETSTYAQIEIENYGTIMVALDAEAAPITVENFKKLASEGFYDGLTLHRIIAGFMMQGGDPLGNGTGGSDEEIKGEFASNGVANPISHKRGAISMARSQMPNSASSQFFICHADSEFLDGQYAAFGFVTEGIEVVDKICEEAKPIDGNGTIPGEAQPVIKKISIIEEN